MTFACILSADKYDFKYVARLFNAVRRNSHLGAEFTCLTDKIEIPDFIKNRMAFIQLDGRLKGWWNKILLFDKKLIKHRYVIFLDLDVIILKNIDYLVSKINSYEFIYAKDLVDKISSSFMIIDTESRLANDVVAKFNPKECGIKYSGDQNYLEEFVIDNAYKTTSLDWWDQYSYKYLINYDNWRNECLNTPPDIAIENITMLNFHGFPKPHDIQKNLTKWPYSTIILKNWV